MLRMCTGVRGDWVKKAVPLNHGGTCTWGRRGARERFGWLVMQTMSVKCPAQHSTTEVCLGLGETLCGLACLQPVVRTLLPCRKRVPGA